MENVIEKKVEIVKPDVPNSFKVYQVGIHHRGMLIVCKTLKDFKIERPPEIIASWLGMMQGFCKKVFRKNLSVIYCEGFTILTVRGDYIARGEVKQKITGYVLLGNSTDLTQAIVKTLKAKLTEMLEYFREIYPRFNLCNVRYFKNFESIINNLFHLEE